MCLRKSWVVVAFRARVAIGGSSRVGPTLRCSFSKADIGQSVSYVTEKPRLVRTETDLSEYLGRQKCVTGPW